MKQVAMRNRIFGHLRPAVVRGPVDQAGLTPASHGHTPGSSPADRGSQIVNLRGAAHFPCHNYQGVLQNPALFEIVKQGDKCPVEFGTPYLMPVKIVLMGIPVEMGHFHAIDTGLEEAAGEQAVLAELMATIVIHMQVSGPPVRDQKSPDAPSEPQPVDKLLRRTRSADCPSSDGTVRQLPGVFDLSTGLLQG